MLKDVRHFNRSKKILLAICFTCIFFAAVEILSRFFIPKPDISTYREHQTLINALGIPALNEIMEEDPYLFWTLKKNLTDKLVSGNILQSKIAFSVNTNSNRFRVWRGTASSAKYRILALGDSCTFGLGVNEDEIWTTLLEKKLKDRGYDVSVLNAGVPGYSAFQGERLLESEGLSLHPDLLIVNFGFNDQLDWASHSDFDTAQKLSVEKFDRILMYSRFYWGLKKFFAMQTHIIPLRKQEKNHTPQTFGAIRPRLNSEEFYASLEKICRICERNHIPVIFLAWPYKFQVDERINEYVYYQNIIAKVSQDRQKTTINLPRHFIMQNDNNLFIDAIHVNAQGNKLVADAIFQEADKMLKPLLTGR